MVSFHDKKYERELIENFKMANTQGRYAHEYLHMLLMFSLLVAQCICHNKCEFYTNLLAFIRVATSI